MRFLVVIFSLCLAFLAAAQRGKKKPKTSYNEGTMFVYYGFNRSFYTSNDLNLIGPGYNFTLEGSQAKDQPSPLNSGVYFNPLKLTVPQYNLRMGYMIKPHLALSLGYDHMKYTLKDNNHVLLSGTISPGVDTINDWQGDYNGFPVVLDPNKFKYANSGSVNYIRFEISRVDQWYTMGKKDWLAISTVLGLGTGPLYTVNSLYFANRLNEKTGSLSGYGISAHAGMRAEFFRHFFLQTDLGAGFMHQLHVRTSTVDANAYARHKYLFASANLNLGILLYVRPTNDCNSCPHW